MRFIHIPLCITLLALLGCEKDTQTLDQKEERNPLIQQGQAYVDIKDWDKAEAAFKQAIENKPQMARPYLELASIYHQHKPDYISAIYYYKHYLELRPDSEKAAFINEQVQEVQMDLAKAILTQSGAFQAIQERDRLLQENAELKRQLATGTKPLQKSPAKTSQPVQQPTVTQTIPKTAKPVSPPKAAHQIYTVVSGDSLTKIAQHFYGNSDYEAIYQANKDRMKSPSDLRVGQTLIIPKQ